MARLFSDNAVTTLATGITSTDTVIPVVNTNLFPNLISPDYFIATITQSGNETSWEKVKVISKSGNNYTVERGYGGTTPQAWSSGSKFEIRWESKAAQDSANVADAGTALIDFGDPPGSQFAIVTVTNQTDIKNTSLIDAWIMAVDSKDHNKMEHAIVPMTVRCGNIVPGVSFDIYAFSEIPLTGVWNVQWIRTK